MSQSILDLVKRAHLALDPHRAIESIVEMSPLVSTNRVFRLSFEHGNDRVAKVSSYGSFVHFKQDHERIEQLIRELRYTRFSQFLAPVVLGPDGKIFFYREPGIWVVFYEKVPFYDFLPPRLSEGEIVAFGRELAEFHLASERASQRIPPTWKTLGSDIALLFERANDPSFLEARGLRSEDAKLIRHHAEVFLENAEAIGYHSLPKMPVLVDWNIGNFSVGFDGDGFKFFSRWDYDWFRIEPRILDFYFCSRVVRDEGDQSTFSYLSSTLFEPRFIRFLKSYHATSPLVEAELRFMLEAYRFFILNYVLLEGPHFFRPSHCARLSREAVEIYLPELEKISAEPLIEAILV